MDQHANLQFGQDLAVGQRIELGTYTFTEDEIIAFAKQWDPQSFHIDREAAAAGYFGEVIASGIHTLGVFQHLCVQQLFSRWAVIAGRGMTDVEFRTPVRPGDRLSGSVEILALTADDRGRTSARIRATMHNQDGGQALALTMDVLVRTHP